MGVGLFGEAVPRVKCFYTVLQFAVLMWLLTYVGALFNGLTLLILGEDPPVPSYCSTQLCTPC